MAEVNFIHEFSNAFTVPVFVEQDARAGAMAQYLFDPTITTENLAYYLVGEGVGLGVIDHGNIINGASERPPKSAMSASTSTASRATAATSDASNATAPPPRSTR